MKIETTTTEIIRESESYLNFPVAGDKLIIGSDLPNEKYVAVDELAPQLDKIYDILSDETLSFEERISMAKLQLLEIEKELEGELNENRRLN